MEGVEAGVDTGQMMLLLTAGRRQMGEHRRQVGIKEVAAVAEMDLEVG